MLTMLCWYGTHCDLVSVVFFVIFHLLTVVIVLPSAALLCVYVCMCVCVCVRERER